MNNVVLMGRMTADPKVYYDDNENPKAKFTVAVDRPKKGEESSADFISCVAYDKTASLVEKWLKKGDPVALNGYIHTGRYEKEGQMVYYTQVVASRIEFPPRGKGDAPSAQAEPREQPAPQPREQSAPQNFAPAKDDDIPF